MICIAIHKNPQVTGASVHVAFQVSSANGPLCPLILYRTTYLSAGVLCAKPSRWRYLASSYLSQAAAMAFSKLARRVENLCHLPSANLKRHWSSRLRVRRYSTNSPSRSSRTLGDAAVSASMVRCLLVLTAAASVASGASVWRSVIEHSPAAWNYCTGSVCQLGTAQ